MLKATHPETGKTIKSTAKMFQLIYKEQGYILDDEQEQTEAPKGKDAEKPLTKYNLPDLRALAKSKGLAVTSKMKQPEIISLITQTADNNEPSNDNPTGGEAEGSALPYTPEADLQSVGNLSNAR